ncbi:vanadium-dependent haloperoxidase [Roseibium sp.]|uniref:vanadium-dependent haloperoxidase n=1 Tax=Roseibium sp. TaxID=1936156 RepID=UPI003A97C4B9
MKLPYSEPEPAGSERAQSAKVLRDLATEVSRLQPQALTKANGEEADHKAPFPANFTKGLEHNKLGLLVSSDDYRDFVEAINSTDRTLFEKHVRNSVDKGYSFTCKTKIVCEKERDVEWRGWESPRAGHVYELQGPDAGAVGMAPAPRVGSSELAAEMAEVYGLALLRDVPFTTICQGGDEKLCEEGGTSVLSSNDIVDLLNSMPFYSGKDVVSSTPHTVDSSGLNKFERNRRFARTQDGANPYGAPISVETAFRGSTKGALVGPYISQFMLVGADSLACSDGNQSGFPGVDARFGYQDGFIPYGSIVIDQRTLTHTNCLDYLTDWTTWLDAQNGANFKGADQFEKNRRFITTPRDLATYVHFDALYEAYLNACLILLAMGTPASKGFPEPSPSKRRDAFATYGGPHILSLVTEVATRCLKAVRRQKFNYHRRARPEALGGRLTLQCLGLGDALGCSKEAFEATFKEIPGDLFQAIVRHNQEQNAMAGMRNIPCDPFECLPEVDQGRFEECNVLLPMAFPEGSPMHPAYGAGHATVAGGCVTMLKAFFEMFEDCNSGVERKLLNGDGNPINYVPNADGSRLIQNPKSKAALTIQGELDKLAANIAIGRNMAGVHYYSDYYDSLRMGERIAIGILLEQAPTYGDTIYCTFKSFDGDMVTISGEAGSCPSLSVISRDGTPVQPDEWWLRHVPGRELSVDMT